MPVPPRLPDHLQLGRRPPWVLAGAAVDGGLPREGLRAPRRDPGGRLVLERRRPGLALAQRRGGVHRPSAGAPLSERGRIQRHREHPAHVRPRRGSPTGPDRPRPGARSPRLRLGAHERQSLRRRPGRRPGGAAQGPTASRPCGTSTRSGCWGSKPRSGSPSPGTWPSPRSASAASTTWRRSAGATTGTASSWTGSVTPSTSPTDTGTRLRYLLTDLQRAVRRMTEALGRERGRPVFLAARVSGSLEMCRRIGYDVPAWVEEGLVDVLIPAGNAVTDASIDAAEFVELCEGTDIAVYPRFRQQPSRSLRRPGGAGGEGPPADPRHRQPLSPRRGLGDLRLQLARQPRLEAAPADDDRIPGEPGRHRQDPCRRPSLHRAGGGLARRLPHRPHLRPGPPSTSCGR